jgi:hypothetical protein
LSNFSFFCSSILTVADTFPPVYKQKEPLKYFALGKQNNPPIAKNLAVTPTTQKQQMILWLLDGMRQSTDARGAFRQDRAS